MPCINLSEYWTTLNFDKISVEMILKRFVQLFPNRLLLKGSRDGAVVRVLASHQCGPGSIPGPGVICGLSLLLVLVLAPRVFRVLRFSSLHKNQLFQIPPGISGRRATLWRCHCKFQFIYLFYLFTLYTVYQVDHVFTCTK